MRAQRFIDGIKEEFYYSKRPESVGERGARRFGRKEARMSDQEIGVVITVLLLIIFFVFTRKQTPKVSKRPVWADFNSQPLANADTGSLRRADKQVVKVRPSRPCPWAKLLRDHRSGCLPPGRHREVEGHLDSCVHCTEIEELMEQWERFPGPEKGRQA